MVRCLSIRLDSVSQAMATQAAAATAPEPHNAGEFTVLPREEVCRLNELLTSIAPFTFLAMAYQFAAASAPSVNLIVLMVI